MTSVNDKRQLLDDSVNLRLSRREGYNGGSTGVPRAYFWFSILLIPVSVLSGMFIVEYNYLFGLEGYESEAEYQYSIDNYSIMFVSPEENEDMRGNDGFTYTGKTGDIFIRKELLEDEEFERVKVVCEHELLHDLGIGSENHDMVYHFEHQVSSPVCEELMERIK